MTVSIRRAPASFEVLLDPGVLVGEVDVDVSAGSEGLGKPDFVSTLDYNRA